MTKQEKNEYSKLLKEKIYKVYNIRYEDARELEAIAEAIKALVALESVYTEEHPKVSNKELINQGVCPCGCEDKQLQSCCSVTGCPIYKEER